MIAYSIINATKYEAIPYTVAAILDNGSFEGLFGLGGSTGVDFKTGWNYASGLVTTGGITYLFDGSFNDSVWTETVKNSVKHEAIVTNEGVVTATLDTIAVKGQAGVFIGYTFNHQFPIDQKFGQDTDTGFAWWQHVEINLGGVVNDVAFAGSNGYWMEKCFFGYRTVDNGVDAEFRYTTYYEVYIDYDSFNGADASMAEIMLSTIIMEDGTYTWASGSTDWFHSNCYITDNGLVDKSAN
jgi:hypothetical protein